MVLMLVRGISIKAQNQNICTLERARVQTLIPAKPMFLVNLQKQVTSAIVVFLLTYRRYGGKAVSPGYADGIRWGVTSPDALNGYRVTNKKRNLRSTIICNIAK